jgi:hypothetical protein
MAHKMKNVSVLLWLVLLCGIAKGQKKTIYLADFINEKDSLTTQSLQKALNASEGKTLVCGPYIIKTMVNQVRRKTTIIGAGIRIKGDSAAIGNKPDGLLNFEGVDSCIVDGVTFDGRENTPGNPYFWFSFINCYQTKNLVVRNCRALYGSAAFVRFADQCHNFEIYNNMQWGGDCMVLGNHNRDNGKSGNFYIHDNFRDNLTGKSEGIGIASGFNRTTGQVWYFDSLRVERNVIMNNRESWAMQLSAVRNARIAHNFIYNCKAGITFAPEKEDAAHQGRAREWYVVPAFSSKDTVEYNVIEGFLATPPQTYVASTFGITVIGDSSQVRYNKIRRFNFGGLRTGEFSSTKYSYNPNDGYVPEESKNKPVKNTIIAYNVIDSVNNDPYGRYYYGPDSAAFFINSLQNGNVQFNTIVGGAEKHQYVRIKNKINTSIDNNSWQGGDKLPVFANAVYQKINGSTTVLSSKAIDEGPLRYQWKQLSGNNCKIVAPANYTTTITGLKTGWYLFELTATDNAGKKSINMALVLVGKGY